MKSKGKMMFNPNREMMHHYLADALALRKAAIRHHRIHWHRSSKALWHDAYFSLQLAKIHREKWLNTPAIYEANAPKQKSQVLELV